jgi:ubiquinone/menaquinone biosynthesis C-methylase UbiE
VQITTFTAATVAAACILPVGDARAQLASKPAAEWTATLESPERVNSLKIDQVVASLRLKGGDVVADLGAGTGLFEAQLAYAVGRGRVYAVDLDGGFLDQIDRKADELHIAAIETVLGTPTDPKLPVKNVDLAFFHDVLHHVADRPAYLKAVAGYLKPTARIAVVEFTPQDSPHKGQLELMVSKEQAAALMAAAGFVPAEEVNLFRDKWFVIYQRR